jgi:lipopolysaccharide biosynthesis glycosyltransferase
MILLYALLFSYFVCFSYYRHMESDSHNPGRQLQIGNSSITIQPFLQLQHQRSLRAPSNETITTAIHRNNHRTQTSEINNSATSMMNHRRNFDNVKSEIEAVLVVIVSDRYEGIIPTVASIVKHTKSKPIDLVLIGNNHDVNERVRQHFMMHRNNLKTTNQADRNSNIRSFTSYSTLEIQTDLINQGYQPIWTWAEWGSSRRKSGGSSWFRTNYTIHVAEWDDLETHAHVLNHVRFYLPHVSHFRNHSYLYFVDDDVLVQKDLGKIADTVMNTLDTSKGMVTPCNIWIWDNQCHSFNFHNADTISSILQTPSLYGDRNVCQSPAETHCYPSAYSNFVESMLYNVTNTTKEHSSNVNDPKNQKAWNFGFSLFALENWRRMDLTSRYETVMKESYRLHVFPETSLTFGLGVAYIAFAGVVECWNDNIMKVRDGFGFIEYNRFAKTFGSDDFITTQVDVIHYTGPTKPWIGNTTIEPRAVQPWLNYMMDEGMEVPEQLPKENGKQLFTLLTSDRAGAQWIMSLLDNHPSICASGESRKPESGFPADVMQPWGTPWLPVCSIKRGCSFAFIIDAVSDLVGSMDRRGRTNRMPARCESGITSDRDELGHHLPRVCNFFRSLNGNYTESAIAAKWVQAFRDENQDLLPCSCPRGTTIKGVKVLVEWLLYRK